MVIRCQKEGSQYICLSVILIDFGFRTGKSYYSSVFLEEFRQVIKERKIPNYIAKDIKISSDEPDTEDIDEENSVDKNSNKGSFDEENYHSRVTRYITEGHGISSDESDESNEQ